MIRPGRVRREGNWIFHPAGHQVWHLHRGLHHHQQERGQPGVSQGCSSCVIRNSTTSCEPEFVMQEYSTSTNTLVDTLVDTLYQVVDTLLSNGKARAVILFVDEDKTRCRAGSLSLNIYPPRLKIHSRERLNKCLSLSTFATTGSCLTRRYRGALWESSFGLGQTPGGLKYTR